MDDIPDKWPSFGEMVGFLDGAHGRKDNKNNGTQYKAGYQKGLIVWNQRQLTKLITGEEYGGRSSDIQSKRNPKAPL